jgi:hypothetical protein
MLGPAFPL